MQNGNATHAALRTLRRKFSSTVATEEGCTSVSLEEKNMNQMPQHSESEPNKGTLDLGQSCNSNSVQLPVDKVHERLNHLESMVEQHSRSLVLLSSQLESQRQSLNSVLEELKHLKMDRRCKVQQSSVTPDNDSTSDIIDVSASGFIDLVTHPWPEWTHFIKHLKTLPFFKELVQVPEVVGVSTTDDSTSIKRVLAKFSKAYDYIFSALSVKDLRTLAEYGCPSDDRRTVASYKRLKDHFQIEKKSASDGVASSELGSPNLRLLDVMRLLFMIAELAKKDGAPDNVKKSILHLLEEIIKLTSICKHGHIGRSETFSNSRAVLPTSSREKSWTVQAKLGVQGSNSSTDAESLSGSNNWECPRCSYFNHEGKNACVKCNFQRPEKSDLNFEMAMPKSSFPAVNRFQTNVCEEGAKPSFLASKRHMGMPILDDNTQALSAEGSPQENKLLGTQEEVFQAPILSEKEEKVLGGGGATDDSDADDQDLLTEGSPQENRLLGTQEEVFQMPILSEQEEKVLGDAGPRDNSNADDHADIFDDILDKGDAMPSRAGPKCSLSELIRENKKAFSLTRKEREQGMADDYGTKGIEAFTDRGHKYDGNYANQRAAAQRAHMQDDSDLESEGKYMRRRSAGRATENGLASSVGKILADRVHNEDTRRRTKSTQWYDTDGDADSETESFGSSRTYGNERSKSNKNKHLGGTQRYSDSESRSKGHWERRTREDSSRVW
ncbi:hypothetical protein GOP47_0024739 [Adiantum capillus-veneris]|uniref:RanBP2-type domain-containing protein n=1 Tax=Adiantum capillus-veneris TaxID=13818 RepID=A0A9D4U2C7_ADICA|nr:hypothetical protein GOP47_0024739 [Adiantum capillus-veneris]